MTPTASPGKPLPVVDVLGALKLPLAAGAYDDDAGAASEFHVRPAAAAGATQLASAAFLVHLDGVQAVGALHGAIRAGTEAGPMVYQRVLASKGVSTGAACEALLGAPRAASSLGGGLVETGQLPAAATGAVLEECRAGRVGIALFDFPVPRELPPGPYFACGAAVTASGVGAAPGCRRFMVDGAGSFSTDSTGDGLGVGRLTAGVLSAADGDFEVGNGAATIVNTGNEPARPTVRLRPFVLEDGASADVVPGVYRVGLRVPARGATPAVAQVEAIDLEAPTVAVREFAQVCLRPGEVAALDFGVTPAPEGVLTPGSYTGSLQVVAGEGSACGARSSELPPSLVVVPTTGPFAPGWTPSASTWGRDADGDRHGDRTVTVVAARPPDGYVASTDDCDDTRASVHPGVIDVADGVDNDCDGVVDGAPAVPAAAATASTAIATLTPTATPTSTAAGGGASSGATSTPTSTPTSTATPAPSPTATAAPGVDPSVTPTASPSPGATGTPTGTPAATPSPTVTPTATPTETASPTASPTVTPTATPVPPTATPTPTVVPAGPTPVAPSSAGTP